jgi:hypothetical protein
MLDVSDRAPEQAELLALVARHATQEGRSDSPYLGLSFWRHDRPTPPRRVCSAPCPGWCAPSTTLPD